VDNPAHLLVAAAHDRSQTQRCHQMAAAL